MRLGAREADFYFLRIQLERRVVHQETSDDRLAKSPCGSARIAEQRIQDTALGTSSLDTRPTALCRSPMSVQCARGGGQAHFPATVCGGESIRTRVN